MVCPTISHPVFFSITNSSLKLTTPALEPSAPPTSGVPALFLSSTSRKCSVSIPGRREGELGFVSRVVLDDPPCLRFLLYNKTRVITGPPRKIQEEDEIQWRTGSPDTALACLSGRLIHSSCCLSWCQHAKLDLHPSQGPQHSFFRTLVTMCNYIFVLSACHSTQA